MKQPPLAHVKDRKASFNTDRYVLSIKRSDIVQYILLLGWETREYGDTQKVNPNPRFYHMIWGFHSTEPKDSTNRNEKEIYGKGE